MNKLKLYILSLSLLFGADSFSQSVEELLKEVVENNPDLKSLNADFEAERSKVDQVSQLPNPTIGSGIPVLRPETRLGPQIVMVSASQMFPWFGTLGAKEDVVISMSKAKFEKIALKKLELFYLLKASYFRINYYTLRLSIIQKSLEIYKSLENIALAKVESGQTLTSDVLRIQLKIQELENEIPLINNEVTSLQYLINQLTNSDLSRKITVEDEITEIDSLNFDTTIFMKKIRMHHPMIATLDYKIEASENMQIANRKMNAPTLGVGVDYSLVGERTDANPVDNGRDILIPKVMLTIPLFRKSYQSKIQEEEFAQESLQYQKESFLNDVLTKLMQYKLEYDNALLNIGLHENQFNTTQKALEILLVNYSSTGKGFDEVLQLENQLLNHEVAVIKYKLQLKLAKAKIERFTEF